MTSPASEPKAVATPRVSRVLWVNDAADFVGGCEGYVRQTALGLQARGIENVLFYRVAEPLSQAYVAGFAGAYPMVHVAEQLRRLRPDVVYIHRLAGNAALLPFLASGIPTLRFFHDHELFCLREHKYTAIGHETCSRPLGLHCYPCLGFVNRSAAWPGIRVRTLGMLRAAHALNRQLTGVVVGSRYMARHVAEHGFARERIHVLPLYAPPPPETPPEPRDPHRLVFLGQLIRGKGLDVLLRALHALGPPWRLDVLGQGRQGPLYEAQARDLGLGDRVRFVGRVSATERVAYLRRAFALVAPSRQVETFGLVGPEAMSVGTPVLASDAGGVSEWLEDGITGLALLPNDVPGLVAAVRRLGADPALWQRLHENGRARYEAQFRPEHHLAGLAALFERLVAASSGEAT